MHFAPIIVLAALAASIAASPIPSPKHKNVNHVREEQREERRAAKGLPLKKHPSRRDLSELELETRSPPSGEGKKGDKSSSKGDKGGQQHGSGQKVKQRSLDEDFELDSRSPPGEGKKRDEELEVRSPLRSFNNKMMPKGGRKDERRSERRSLEDLE
ncbi:hypothetical protein DACRYDRAFT_110370 [Dacryopinax primogenitus]|uniref:Uncharacterized protein n=1 Tax=Dacryopinax primogenitus (strain DJM 731) TaxID=1858805 RepID=M5G5L1_DACPD|nr:uncharacterized protein DACRYDRAFT_110370 [Dacryopinax primogenitus]EJT99047.1 hypothetical protein DACRYDRAFT_110370 [Dacryopinax primogenitus]